VKDKGSTRVGPVRLVRRGWYALMLSAGLFLSGTAAHAEGWRERYARAQQQLVEGRDADAAAEFDSLAIHAATPEDRKVAEEMGKVARARLAFQARRPIAPHLRTSDELSLLYTTAFVYGFGSSAWLALQLQPKTFAGAVIPFVVLTSASVAGVAVVDDYRPFRLGVPQSIAAGMFLGIGEGAWLVGYEHSVAKRRDDASYWRAPTLWPGFVVSMGSAALQPNPERRSETAFATGGAAYNLGLAAAIAFGPRLSPSLARVRFVDLGGLAGTLLGVGSYLLVAGSDNSSRGSLSAAALGAASGVGVAWWATAGMPSDRRGAGASDSLKLRPVFAPVERGWTLGVAGTL
jgi:hypothetical protein